MRLNRIIKGGALPPLFYFYIDYYETINLFQRRVRMNKIVETLMLTLCVIVALIAILLVLPILPIVGIVAIALFIPVGAGILIGYKIKKGGQ